MSVRLVLIYQTRNGTRVRGGKKPRKGGIDAFPFWSFPVIHPRFLVVPFSTSPLPHPSPPLFPATEKSRFSGLPNDGICYEESRFTLLRWISRAGCGAASPSTIRDSDPVIYSWLYFRLFKFHTPCDSMPGGGEEFNSPLNWKKKKV